MRRVDLLSRALVACALMTAPYIDWEIAADLGRWHLNVPVADLCALLALGLAGVSGQLARVGIGETLGWLTLVAVGLASAHIGAGLPGVGPDGYHTLLRKPIFMLLGWRIAFAGVVRRTTVCGNRRWAIGWLTAGACVCAGVLIASSIARIQAGQTFWWAAIAGLTNNGKTLAVYLAPLLALIGSPVAVALVLIAIGLSWSKSAWITALFALAWVRLPARVRGPVVAVGAVAGLVAMTFLPYLARSPEQIDALNSRISLDKRAWEMFCAHPFIGWGAGSNVRYEVSTYPDYRVNGVDAHGVFAKLGSEFGVLGTLGWLVATTSLLLHFRRRARGSRFDDALYGCFLALHLNLLTSTETFSQTHWAILGLLCGLSARRR